MGSSPRVRGKLGARRAAVMSTRLIPARAGKTGWALTMNRATSAHPRACGENGEQVRLGHHDQGSSPRVRGKLKPWMIRSRAWGLIPARAGKTAWTMAAPRAAAAHPRACGENGLVHCHPTEAPGSSPRVRGKLGLRRPAHARVGLIPARAGKTCVVIVIALLYRAHPRACGENPMTVLWTRSSPGSSPRVRGKLVLVERASDLPRLIPARAGKTA